MDEVLKNSGVIIGAIIVYIAPKIEQYLKDRSKKKNFINNLTIEADINRELLYLVNTHRASRASIIDFSNGTSNYAGLPFNHATMSYEEVSINTPRIKQNIQKMPVSSMVESLLKLEKSTKGFSKTTDVDDSENIAIANRSYGVKTAYDFKIGGNLIDGVVSIVWVNDYENLDPSQVLDIKACVSRIRTLRSRIKKHD